MIVSFLILSGTDQSENDVVIQEWHQLIYFICFHPFEISWSEFVNPRTFLRYSFEQVKQCSMNKNAIDMFKYIAIIESVIKINYWQFKFSPNPF